METPEGTAPRLGYDGVCCRICVESDHDRNTDRTRLHTATVVQGERTSRRRRLTAPQDLRGSTLTCTYVIVVLSSARELLDVVVSGIRVSSDSLQPMTPSPGPEVRSSPGKTPASSVCPLRGIPEVLQMTSCEDLVHVHSVYMPR